MVKQKSRWTGKSKKEVRDFMRMIAFKKSKSMTQEQRVDHARMMIAKRWHGKVPQGKVAQGQIV